MLVKQFYLIHKESGTIEAVGSKGKLRRIQKQLEDREMYKVSKYQKLSSRPTSTAKRNPSKPIKRKTRKRWTAPRALRRRIIKRKFKTRPETVEDMRRIVKAGVNVTCRRGNNLDKDEILLELI